MKYCITLGVCLFVFVSFHLQAQTCTLELSGTVTASNGETLPGASIVLQPGGRGTTADAEGRFRLVSLCPGTYTIAVQFVGYQTVRTAIGLQRNETIAFRLELDVTELKEVVVEEHLQHTEHATNYAVISEKQLHELAGKTLGESLRDIAGVNTVQAGPGIFKPVIHGVHGQRVLILNHGIRQEGQQWGAEHAPEIDPFLASNIVVIKDASAIKYGTDAIGGVIVVNPPSLPESPGLGGSMNTVFQSNGRSGVVSGMLEGGINNHNGWGWRVQGTAKRSGDFHTPDYNLTNTGIREMDFSAAAGYHASKFGVEAFVSRFQSTIGILKGTAISNLDDLERAMEREPPQFTSRFSYAIDEPRQEVSHTLVKLNGHMDVPNGQLRLQYGFQQNNRQEYDIRVGNLSRLPAIDLQLFTHSLDAEWERTMRTNQSWSIGVNTMYQDNNNVYGTQRIPFIPNFTALSGGLFSITKWSLRQWTIDVGARYDFRFYKVSGYDYKNSLYRDQLNFHNVSATVGGTYRVNKRNVWSLSVNNAWRPPHVAELYSLGTHQSAAAIEYGLLLNDQTNEVMDINDVSFRNEQALKVVTGYSHSGDKWQWEVTGYANYIRNYIYLKPTGVTKNVRGTYPYFRYTQTDALFTGLDISASYALAPNWRTGLQGSLLHASDVTNHDYLVFIPPNRFHVSLRYEKPVWSALSDVYAELKLMYVARQTRAPRTITPRAFREASETETDPLNGSDRAFDFMAAPTDYALVQAAMGVSLKREKIKYDIRLAADNVLNTAYREYTNRFRYYADEIGRNFIISIKTTF
jgi:iron complex outermembrane receptor protein